MREIARVEMIGKHAVASFPVRIPVLFLPHVALGLVIVAASTIGIAVQLISLTGL